MIKFRRTPAQSEEETLSLVRTFQSEAAEIDEAKVPIHLRATLLIFAVMLVVLTITAGLFNIDRVVTSTFGQIVTTEPTIVVQPLDPSIIKTISVKEGDHVKAGQLIAELDPTLAAADVDALILQVSSLDAEIARCEAELADKPFNYVAPDTPGAQKYAAIQSSLFIQRRAQYEAQINAFDEQIAQANANIVKLKNDESRYGDEEKLSQQLETIRTELVQKQLDSQVNLLQAIDAKTELLRQIEADRNELIVSQHLVEGTKANREAFIKQWHAMTNQELVTARNNHDTADGQLQKAQKHEDLVRLVAPEDAIVLRVAKLSVGSVLQPGESFIELASLKSPIEAEITVDPRDVGFIRPGDSAVIKLDPYNFVEHGWAEGKLNWVSEGTFTAIDQGSGGPMSPAGTSPQTDAGTQDQTASTNGGHPFYKARIAVQRTDLKDVPGDFRLLPGMTLTADIKVGTRSLLWYLMRGIIRGFDEAMREP